MSGAFGTASFDDEAPGSGVLAVVQDEHADEVPDALDNCSAVANADQRDTDGDRYGNRGDPDFNQDGVVTTADYLILRGRLRTSDPLTDLNGDGKIRAADYLILRSFLTKPPGPNFKCRGQLHRFRDGGGVAHD